MADIPLSTRVYTVILVIVTLATLVVALLAADLAVIWQNVPAALVLFAMVLLAERLDVTFPQSVTRFHVSTSAAFAIAAGLTVGPFLGGVVVAVAHVADGVLANRAWIKTTVNAAVHGLCTALSGAVFISLAEPAQAFSGSYPSPLGSVHNFIVTLLATLGYTLLNTALLALIAAPTVGVSAITMWRSNIDTIGIEIVTLVTLGSLIPVLVHEALLAVVLLFVPLFAGPQLAFRGLRQAQLETRATMEGLVDALEQRDAYTHRHSIRVADYVEAMLDEMSHLPRQRREAILAAARVHDLGKIATRDQSLKKPGALNAEERREMERHAAAGADIVGKLEEYRPGVETIRHHHERWDGTGYPDGLRGEEIPLGARLIAIADAYDAMTTDRVYRAALDVETASAELERGKGTQFDPELIDLFLNVIARRTERSHQRQMNAPRQTCPAPVDARSAARTASAEPHPG